MTRLGLLTLFVLAGCANQYQPPQSTFPEVPAELMTRPCKMLIPSADSNEDLTIDVQNAECVRQLRLKVYRLQDWVRNIKQ